MTDHALDDLVNELRAAIESSDTLAGEERDRLEALAQRIDEELDERVDTERQGLVEQIGESVGHFETDHPALVKTLNRIAQTLNAAGI
jgi:Domain of unknown function (DUF4404)